jgi:hypothetical protein
VIPLAQEQEQDPDPDWDRDRDRDPVPDPVGDCPQVLELRRQLRRQGQIRGCLITIVILRKKYSHRLALIL